jgi:hypothetical protein
MYMAILFISVSSIYSSSGMRGELGDGSPKPVHHVEIAQVAVVAVRSRL